MNRYLEICYKLMRKTEGYHLKQEEIIKYVKILFTVILICIGSILLVNSVEMGKTLQMNI